MLQTETTGAKATETGELSNGLPWYALQVRSRFEACVADYLAGQCYEWFLPTYTSRKRWSDRIKSVEAPLFPGYLFCRLDIQNRLPILKTPGVIQIVGCNKQPIAVDETEIKALQAVVASGIPNQPWPFGEIGDQVQIESGPLRGLRGILVESRGNRRLVLSVTLLQRSVAVEIDALFVAAARPATASMESGVSLLSV